MPLVGERTWTSVHAPTGACVLPYFTIVLAFNEVTDWTYPAVVAVEVLHTLGFHILEFFLYINCHPVLVL